MTEPEFTLAMWALYMVSAVIVWWLASSLFLRGDSQLKRISRLLLAVLVFTPTLTLQHGQLAVLPATITLFFELLAHNSVGAVKALLPWCLVMGIVLVVDAAISRNDAV